MIKDIPPDARPREKLLAQGPAALADAELVALLLRTGLKGRVGAAAGAVAARRVRAAWPACCNAGPADLKRVKGLGPAKRAEDGGGGGAGPALARSSGWWSGPAFDAPGQVCKRLPSACTWPRASTRCSRVLFLDAQHRLLQFDEMFRGTLTQTSVYPREVVQAARWR